MHTGTNFVDPVVILGASDTLHIWYRKKICIEHSTNILWDKQSLSLWLLLLFLLYDFNFMTAFFLRMSDNLIKMCTYAERDVANDYLFVFIITRNKSIPFSPLTTSSVPFNAQV